MLVNLGVVADEAGSPLPFLLLSMKLHALAVELFGTFLLSLAVYLSLSTATVISTPVIAGLTLGLLVYMIGPMSGAHVNPAVTLGLMSVKLIKPLHGLSYIVAQLLGGALAWAVGTLLVATGPGAPTTIENWHIGIGEALGAMILVMAVSSVARHKTPHEASGLVVGGGLLLGISLAVTVGSGGVLNPAVAVSLNVVSFSYLLMPVIGGVVGAWVYKLVCTRD